MGIKDRVAAAWNAFRYDEQQEKGGYEYAAGVTSTHSTHRPTLTFSSEKSLTAAVYTRIAIDVAALKYKHIELDDQGRYKGDKRSMLNWCLNFEPNLDQSPRALLQDIVLTMFDDGVAAVVPVESKRSPLDANVITDILEMRVGQIAQFRPRHITTEVYNIDRGDRQQITLPKRICAIVENPLYSVMNESNSTLKRLVRKLNLLDSVDEASGSGKLDLIIQLPYSVKHETRRNQAEERMRDVEDQLRGSEYGIAYIDSTEKITQLNRPAEHNLLKQIQYLTELLFGQLGLTEKVLTGTAETSEMVNYYNRTIEPIAAAITQAMTRSWLGYSGVMSRKERIRFFNDPFRYVTIDQLGETADKLLRNEVLTSNEVRTMVLGLPPSTDPKADELRNANMPQEEPNTADAKGLLERETDEA